MGLFDSIGKLFSGKGGTSPKLDRSVFDISKQAAEYENRLKEQAGQTTAQNRQLSEALQQQATGQGPLAGAAMRAASSRNLAQTLSAAQSMGGSPLAARQAMQARGQQSRDVAQLGIEERLKAQEALGQQLGRAAETGRADVLTGFNIAKSPQEMMQEYEKKRFDADVARQNAIKQQQAGIGSALLGMAGTALGGMIGGPAGAAIGNKILPAALEKDYSNVAAYGKVVEGKSKHQQDTIADDTQPHMLSPGEMVVPKTIVKKGPEAVKKFAKKLMELEKENPNPVNGFASLMIMKKQMQEKKRGK